MYRDQVRLLFKPERWRPLPDSARAHIVLNWHTTDSKHGILLSPECRTEMEVECYVKDLKKNLDQVLAEARRKFARSRRCRRT